MEAEIHAFANVLAPNYQPPITFTGNSSADASAIFTCRIQADPGEADGTPVRITLSLSRDSKPEGGTASISVSLDGFSQTIGNGSSIHNSWVLNGTIGSLFTIQFSASASSSLNSFGTEVRKGASLGASFSVVTAPSDPTVKDPPKPLPPAPQQWRADLVARKTGHKRLLF